MFLWCLAGRTNTSSCYELFPLLSSKLDLDTLVSLCQASKQLHNQCLDLPDQLLQSIVHQAINTKQIYDPTWQSADTNSRWSSLAWLLGALSKRWGIMQLAARLDLQQALLAAKSDRVACIILIRAGARITWPVLLLSSGPYNPGPRFWAQIYQHLQLFWDLPRILLEVLQAPAVDMLQVLSDIVHGGLGSPILFQLVAVVSKIHPSGTTLMTLIRSPLLQTPQGRWTPEQVLELALLAAKRLAKASIRSCLVTGGREESLPLLCLLQMPSAQEIPGRGYVDLLVVLFSCPWVECMQEIADLVVPRVEWHQQLVEQIAAAFGFFPEAIARQCLEGGGKCSVCILLQALTSSGAFARAPFQQQVALYTAATSTSAQSRGIGPLLQAVTSPASSAQPGDVLAAISAVMDPWQFERQITDSFLRLLQHQTVQQLQPAEAQLLLQKAVHPRCAIGLHSLLISVPAARGITVEVLQQLLKQAIGHGCDVTVRCLLVGVRSRAEVGVDGLQQLLGLALDARADSVGRLDREKPEVVAALVSGSLPAVQQLGPQELQLLLVKSFRLDDSLAVGLLMDLPAAKQMPFAGTCELMLQAASAGASNCLLKLLQLVPQAEQVPSAVLPQVLPVLMKLGCRQPVLTPASVKDMLDSDYSRGCAVCSLLKAAAGNLAVADVCEVLVAAAKEHVQYLHVEGLASLPGLDGLGNEQVEQILLAAIEALELDYGLQEDQLLGKLEQLQGELLFTKHLPSAAVHRLMVACVGKAVQGGVGRLREELGLQGEGWEGPLGPEQFGQLLKVATCRRWRTCRDDPDQDENVDCRPCLLALAKLLPSAREKQQVVEGLRAAVLEYENGLDSESDGSGESGLDGESDRSGESNLDGESDQGGERALGGESDRSGESNLDGESDPE